MWTNAQAKGPFVLLISGTSQGVRCTYGTYASGAFPEKPAEVGKDQDYHIANTEDAFFFVYLGDKSRHYTVKGTDALATVSTDFSEGGVINVLSDALIVSYSSDYVTSAHGEVEGLVPLEGETGEFEFPSQFTFEKMEIWTANLAVSRGA